MCRPIIRIRFQSRKRSTGLAITLAMLLVCAYVGFRVRAQAPELTVQANFAAQQSLSPLAPLALSLNRPLAATEGRLAVFIGVTDMTALFTVRPNELRYAPKAFPLPAGESPVIVYLVSPRETWQELARFTLSVAADPSAAPPTEAASESPRKARKWGLDKATINPTLTVNVEAQPVAKHFPAATRPDRPTYTDVTMQGTLRTEIARGPFSAQTNFDLVGASFPGKSLRFGELGDDAPNIDLSNYLMQFQFRKAQVTMGHVSFGTNRFLMDSFASRGMTVAVPINKRFDVAVAALNGTSIVGWNNFTGLDSRKHQVVSGTLGYEFLPERPGGLRVEANVLHGSLLPLSNFNQGNITDAEQSKGFGVRVRASNKSERLRTDMGFARSRFNNPRDPSLEIAQGVSIAPARANTSNAHYVEASYDLLRDLALTKNKKANLTLGYRHERVAPLFRSVAVTTQANRLQHQYELNGSIGEVTVSFTNFNFHDNLDNLSSILKSFTRRNNLLIGAPLASLWGDATKPKAWLPRVSYSYDRTHQFAPVLPTNADFKLPQLPNQISTNQTLSTEWQAGKWRAGYRYDDTLQDNQSDRDFSTLRNGVHGFTLGLTTKSLDVNVELSRENLQSRDTTANKDKERNDRTLRFSTLITWRMTKDSVFTATLSDSLARSLGDLSLTSNGRNIGYDLQWSHGFGWGKSEPRKFQAQFYIRYSNQYSRAFDALFGINNRTRSRTLNTGLSFTFS
jgi:hypothetical protein